MDRVCASVVGLVDCVVCFDEVLQHFMVTVHGSSMHCLSL